MNSVGFYTVLTDATYGAHGLAAGRMPQCAVMVNIGLAVPTLSCMACMSYSGGSVKYTQVAVSAWDLHIETADHGRRHLRMARDLCPSEIPPQDGYVRIPAVLAHFRLLRHDNAAYAEALHKALYIFNMMERHLAFGDNSSWHSEHHTIAAMAADRALLLGKRCVGKVLRWEGAVAWDRARKAAAAAPRCKVECKEERLSDTLAADTAFVQSLSAARRVRLAALVRAQGVKETEDHAALLAADAAAFEHAFDQQALLAVPELNDLYEMDMVVEDLAGLSASESAESDGHARGVKRQHEGDEKE